MSELRELLEDAFSVHIGALLTEHDRIKDKFDEYKERGKAAVEKKDDEKKDVLSILDGLTAEEKAKLKEALLNGDKEST